MKTILISDNRTPVAREMARLLAADGHRVLLNDLGAPMPPDCERVCFSLTDLDALKAFLSQEDVQAVIHPAPPALHATIADATEAQWEQAREDGAVSAMVLTRAVGDVLGAKGRGALIYLGSIHAEKPMGSGFLLSMSCGSTQMLCREAAISYGAKGVNFFYVQRGVMREDADNLSDYSNLYVKPEQRHPRGEWVEAEQLKGLVDFLLTENAGVLNGADLRADGGLTMYYGKPREEERTL